MNKFTSNVFSAIKQYNMLSENDKVLIALSGGKDSVALLLFLHEHAKQLRISVFAAHINHMIRGEAADRDQRFCEELCEKLGITLFVQKINVPQIALETSKSIEEAARNIRYKYLNELCKAYSIDKIATAHTASDNTETVIYNIARGSGTQGICGIPPKRDNIIRPLILCTKEQTAEYCIGKNTKFCTDATNDCDLYDRNNIRLNIVPHLKKRNPSIDNSVAKLSYIARCDRMLIKSIADEFLKKHSGDLPLEETAKLFEDEKMLSCSHEILCQKSGVDISFDIFRQCADVIRSRHTGKRVKISNNVYLYVEYDKIKFKSDFKHLEYYEQILTVGNTIKLNEKVTISMLTEKNSISYKNVNNLTKKATLNFDTIYGDIFVRKKKDADSYIVDGMTKSVKKFFSDSKISRDEREYIPIVCDERGIVWTPGMRVCDRVRPQKGGNNITIIVEFTR